jgi:hypothetical protein
VFPGVNTHFYFMPKSVEKREAFARMIEARCAPSRIAP